MPSAFVGEAKLAMPNSLVGDPKLTSDTKLEDGDVEMTVDKYIALPTVARRWQCAKSGTYFSGYRLFRQLKSCNFITENVTLQLFPWDSVASTFDYTAELLRRDFEFNGDRNEGVSVEIYSCLGPPYVMTCDVSSSYR